MRALPFLCVGSAVVQGLRLILGLAGQLHAKLFECAFISRGEDDRGNDVGIFVSC